jgi:dTDP-D-glucose 4,6-dehydratase
MEKVERLCGWSARTSLEEGLARTVAWYRENEHSWSATERPKSTLSSS